MCVCVCLHARMCMCVCVGRMLKQVKDTHPVLSRGHLWDRILHMFSLSSHYSHSQSNHLYAAESFPLSVCAFIHLPLKIYICLYEDSKQFSCENDDSPHTVTWSVLRMERNVLKKGHILVCFNRRIHINHDALIKVCTFVHYLVICQSNSASVARVNNTYTRPAFSSVTRTCRL